jgi:hypothetical protein
MNHDTDCLIIDYGRTLILSNNLTMEAISNDKIFQHLSVDAFTQHIHIACSLANKNLLNTVIKLARKKQAR